MAARQIVKIAVAAALLALIAARVDFSESLRLIVNADPALVLAALATCLAIVAADAAFWASSMRAVGFRIGFGPAAVFSLAGWFFANFAPSTVGADLFRAAQMRAAGVDVKRAARIVIAARVMSFASLIAVIGAGSPLAFQRIDDPAMRHAIAALFVLGSIGFLAVAVAAPSLARRVAPRAPSLAAFAIDVRALLTRTPASGWVLLTGQHVLRVAGAGLIALALGVPASALDLFALVPAALLIAMIPVSFGGWGVREASMVHFLAYAGIGAPAALAISVTYGLTRTFVGALGGVLWMIVGKEHYRFAIDAAAPVDARAAARD